MNWHEYFLKMVLLISSKSKDRSSRIGAVIVGPDNEIRSTGYNSFPRGLDDEVESRHERPEKYEWTEHAERNAIYNAARIGVSLKNCRIYQDWIPCTDCARGIVQSGISQVIIDGMSSKANDIGWSERWGEKQKISCMMLSECGVDLLIYDYDKKMVIKYVE